MLMKRNLLIASVVAVVLVAALVAVAAVAVPRVNAAPLGDLLAATTPVPGTTPVPANPGTTTTNSAYLGIAVSTINAQIATQFKLNVTEGVVIASVTAGTPAATAGLQAGDVINKVNGVVVKTSEDVVTEVRRATAGDVVTLDITRAGTAMTVKVTSIQAPASQMQRGLGRGNNVQPKTTPVPGTGNTAPTYKSLPSELQGLLNLPFDSQFGSTQTFKDANGNVVTVYWIPGTVTAISATSITITPNNPQTTGGTYSIDSTTIIRAGKTATGTSPINVGDKVTVVVVGTSSHASIISAGGMVGRGMMDGGMHGFGMPFGRGDGFRGMMPFGRGGQNQQPQPTPTPGSGA